MDTLLATSSDSVFLKEVFNVFKSIKCPENRNNIIRMLFASTGKIIGLLIIRYYMKECTSITDSINPLFQALFYRTRRYDLTVTSLDLYIGAQLSKEVNKSKYVNCFPIYYDKLTTLGILTYIPVIHSNYIRQITEDAKIQYSKFKKPITVCSTLDSNFIPKRLFPSNNYMYLHGLIEQHFKVVSCTGLTPSLGILINGRPGLGKSMTADYLGTQERYGEIKIIDMTKHLDEDFSEISKQVLVSKKDTIIIMFDELDKYMDYYSKESYMKLKENNTTNPDQTKNKKEKNNEENNQKVNNYHLTTTEEEHCIRVKTKFLYNILALLETRNFPKGVVFIFCANNFDSIFEGIDEKHVTSLKDRLLKVQYNNCNTEEFCRYIRYLNDQMSETDLHVPLDELNVLLENFDVDISITYRKLSQTSIQCMYNIRKIIHEMKNHIHVDETQVYDNFIALDQKQCLDVDMDNEDVYCEIDMYSDSDNDPHINIEPEHIREEQVSEPIKEEDITEKTETTNIKEDIEPIEDNQEIDVKKNMPITIEDATPSSEMLGQIKQKLIDLEKDVKNGIKFNDRIPRIVDLMHYITLPHVIDTFNNNVSKLHRNTLLSILRRKMVELIKAIENENPYYTKMLNDYLQKLDTIDFKKHEDREIQLEPPKL